MHCTCTWLLSESTFVIVLTFPAGLAGGGEVAPLLWYPPLHICYKFDTKFCIKKDDKKENKKIQHCNSVALLSIASDIKLKQNCFFLLMPCNERRKKTKRNNKYKDQKKYNQSRTNERKVLKARIKRSYKKLYFFLATHEYNYGPHTSWFLFRNI